MLLFVLWEVCMSKFILIKPSPEYAEQIAAYRKEFLDCGSSMDGCGL